MRAGVVDVGTNTVRLLIADVLEDEMRVVAARREITRLGKGVDAERRLSSEAMERTLSVVERFVEQAREAGAERVRVAGTSALRDASDRQVFEEAVSEATSVKLEVLTGEREASLSLLGATYALGPGDYLVCDIGGGSTELSSSRGGWISLDIGSVRLKERYLADDPPSSDQVAAARSLVRTEVEHAADELPVADPARLVGVAGSVTSLAALVLGLFRYDGERVHHSVMSRDDVDGWTKRLLNMTAEEVAALGPIEPARADVIAAGAMILTCVMEAFGADEVLVSEHDILHGLAIDLVR